MIRYTQGVARCVALALLSCPAVAFATNGYFMHGYGNLSKGMAGVAYALPQDALAPASNPAGLTLLNDRIDLGLDWIGPRRSASIDGNRQLTLRSADGDFSGDRLRSFFVPELGYRRQLGESLSFGLALYGNGGLNTDYADNPYAGFGSTGRAGVDLAQLFVSPALAWQINERNSIGVAVNAVLQRFKAYGLDAFSTTVFPGPYSETPDRMTNQGYDSSFGISYRLGWLVEPVEALTFGLSWQPKTRMMKFDKYRGLFPDQGSFDIPENYGAGAAYRWRNTLIFAADVQVIRYDRVRSLGTPVQPLHDGALLGSDDGPGFGWASMTVKKLGLGWQATPYLRLNSGYSWGNQPVRAGQTLFNILAPAVVEQHYAVGASYRYNSRVDINVYYCKGPTNTLRGQNSIPPNRLSSPLPPESLGGGEADIRLSGESAGLSMAYRF
ncbi:MAG: outer membrane protein transport protein [Pseudomonadota bacterium]|nr:outer membrane protein transport protein [Pseudomonadota bacterium]